MSLIDQIKGWFKTPFDHQQALSLYRGIVTQSRLATIYENCGVDDTADGRYDVVALHAFLVMRRLTSGDRSAHELSQSLHDLMFADMDQNLREMGIGDHGMPKRMKKLAEGFRGRVAAYDNGLGTSDDDSGAGLAAALKRNLYRKMDPSDAAVGRMVDYVRAQDRHLSVFPLERLMAGEVVFMVPEVQDGDPVRKLSA